VASSLSGGAVVEVVVGASVVLVGDVGKETISMELLASGVGNEL
jgi:hypothetical protein